METSQTIANRFTIDDAQRDLLGRGGMGLVYRAIDTLSGHPVAIKALKPDVVTEHPDIVARFAREGEALRQLDHPNIVQMITAVEEDGHHYLVMEYVEGGSLKDLLEEKGRLPIKRVLEISLDLADALTRAHRLDIVHRDLKPANVLLAHDGTPRLTDFGLAHVADSPNLTEADVLMGTIDYLSPEACRGEEPDTRTDIWAFGVMLYEMLAGNRPFAGDSTVAKILAILTESVPDLAETCPTIPDALADLIYRMLEKDRYQRIPSVRLVGAELEALLREQGSTTSPIPRSVTSLPQASRFITPTPSSPTRQRHNLPTQPTPFIGRQEELAVLSHMLEEPAERMVTILAPGGMGKTRLALEAGAARLDRFEHGVYFVPLAPLQSTDAILPTVADAVGLSFAQGDPRQQLLDYLSQKHMLLIMDNFEHLLDGANLTGDILEAAPNLKILVTSRARLNTRGEFLFRLTGMGFPDWETPEDALEYSAVKLFMQSARRVRPNFELQADDLTYVSRICRLVQGLPLGILLAAAWIEMLSPEEIADEIEKNLDFLETDLQDIPERQRSIRAVFETSWNALSEREQEVLQALSVFRGGFTRQAAQEITGATLRELMALVNKSLMYRAPTGRYGMHELMHQYAEERLAQAPAVEAETRERHCAYYTAALKRWEPGLYNRQQRAVREEMAAEIENARAAWNWAAAHKQIGRLKQSAIPLTHFYGQMGRAQESCAACQVASEALANLTDDEALAARATVLMRQYQFTPRNEPETTMQLMRQAEAILDQLEQHGQDVRQARADILRFWVRRKATDQEIRWNLLKEREALYRAVGHQPGIADTLDDLGQLAHEAGCHVEAKQYFEQTLAIWRALDNPMGIADVLNQLSVIEWVHGRFVESKRLVSESMALRREFGGPYNIAWGLHRLCEVLLINGEFNEAQAAANESIAIYTELGDQSSATGMYAFLGEVELHLGYFEQARARLQEAASHWEKIGFQWGTGFAHLWLGMADLATRSCTEAHRELQIGLDTLRRVGHRENAAWALAGMGYSAYAICEPDQAWQHLADALQAAAELDAFIPRLLALPAAALLLADAGEAERAVELYALASRYGFVANSRWFADVVEPHIAAAAASLPPETATAAQERGCARNLNATTDELLTKLLRRL